MRHRRPPSAAAWGVWWALALVLAFARPAGAVVPGLAGPLQALGQLMPQLFALGAATVAGLVSHPRVRALLVAARARTGARLPWLLLLAGGAATILLLCASGPHLRALATKPADAGTESWTTFRGGMERTGTTDHQPGPSRPTTRWTHMEPEANWSSSPAVVGDRLYCGSTEAGWLESHGTVCCLEIAHGQPVWQFRAEHPVFSSPAVVAGKVYVGEGLHTDADCHLYCLDAATGAKLWSITTRSHVESSPTVAGGRVYFGAGADGVYCAEAGSGQVVWHRTGLHVDLSPTLAEGRVLVGTGYGNLAALALDARTGSTIWERASTLPVWGDPAIVDGKVLWGRGNGDFGHSDPHPRGDVWCLDETSGRELWRCPLPDAALTAVAVADSRAFAGCRDGRVYGINLASGQRAWATAIGAPVLASPTTDGAHVYAISSQGRAMSLNAATGTPCWSSAVGDAGESHLYSSPVLSHGQLYVGTSQGEIVCLQDSPAAPPGAR